MFTQKQASDSGGHEIKAFCVAVFYVGTIVKMKAISHIRLLFSDCWDTMRLLNFIFIQFEFLRKSELREWIRKMWKWSMY